MQAQGVQLGSHRSCLLAPLRRVGLAARARSTQTAVTCQQLPERKLILMRHAISQGAGPTRDHDRPILPEGVEAARQVARQLKEAGWVPDVVICSNALRTRQTFEAMRQELPELEDADAHFLGSLYTVAALDGQTRAHLQNLIAAEANGSHQCVLCMGHDRGWSEAASSFTGRQVGLGNSHAALLEGKGSSWAEALHPESQWELYDVLVPNGEKPRLGQAAAAEAAEA